MTPEQEEAIKNLSPEDQEAIKNLSPEELDELMQKNCLFCGIVSGQVPTVRVYSDDNFVGILDINPASLGHTILLPKKHVMSVEEMEGDLLSAIKRIVSAQKKGFGTDGVSVLIPEGASAGQKLPHASVHLIPRVDGDGLFNWEGKKAEEKELKKAGEKIVQNLAPLPEQEDVPEVVEEVDDSEVDRFKDEERVP
tara:strand:+ start:2538 stop:3122 length:585 start_codon:yes stop_codon:yes gene_type:complete